MQRALARLVAAYQRLRMVIASLSTTKSAAATLLLTFEMLHFLIATTVISVGVRAISGQCSFAQHSDSIQMSFWTSGLQESVWLAGAAVERSSQPSINLGLACRLRTGADVRCVSDRQICAWKKIVILATARTLHLLSGSVWKRTSIAFRGVNNNSCVNGGSTQSRRR